MALTNGRHTHGWSSDSLSATLPTTAHCRRPHSRGHTCVGHVGILVNSPYLSNIQILPDRSFVTFPTAMSGEPFSVRCCCPTLPPVLFLWRLYGIYETCPCGVRKTQIQPWQKQGSSFFSLTQQAKGQDPGTSSLTALVSSSQLPTSSPRGLLRHLQPLLHTSQLERKNMSRGHTQFLKQLLLPLLNDH